MSLAQGIFHSHRGPTIFGLGAEPATAGWTVSERVTIANARDAEAYTLWHPDGAKLYAPPLRTVVATMEHPNYLQQIVFTEPSGRVVYDWQVRGGSGPDPRPASGIPTRSYTLPGLEILGRRWPSARWLVPLALVGGAVWWFTRKPKRRK